MGRIETMMVTQRCTWILLLFLVCLLPARTQTRAQANRPNFDLFVYRRAYTPEERVSLRLSVFNEKAVDFTAYGIDLPALTPTSKALEQMKARIAAIDVAKLSAARSWRYQVGKSYPDQWEERAVKAPSLKPGVYLIRARAGNVEKRTWLAITDIALVAKRSLQELLVYAVNARTGQPQSGLLLARVDAAGKRDQGVTDAHGIWRSPQPAEGNLWLSGKQNGMPAFLLSGAPAPPEPYAVHIATDRPIYRPDNKVLYRGTIRERLESDAPGGFTLRPYAGKKATVEIRDSTDALIARQEVTTNNFGSFEGYVSLASEPPLGHWQIVVVLGKFRAYSGFEVQEYRKPEFTVGVQFPASHALGGTKIPVVIHANYLFGQPVADATVTYQIQFTWEGPGDPAAAGNVEPPYAGQGVTGPDGQLPLEIQTQRLPTNRRLSVTATVTDLSRRSQQAGDGMLITAGQFQLDLELERAVYRVHEPMMVTVHAVDYDQKPVAARVRVRLIEIKYDREHRPYKQIVAHDVSTDAAGKGVVTFMPERPGYLQLEAEAFDPDNNKILAWSNVWVAGDEEADFDYPTLNLIADRSSYRPGETATLLVNTSLVTSQKRKKKPIAPADPNESAESQGRERAYALVTVEGERIYSHRTVLLHSRSTALSIPLTSSYFPSVQVSVLIVMDKHVYEQSTQLSVFREDQELQVSVQPAKERYAPGETADYTLTTRDYRGQPVSAEVAFGVVDVGIYALMPDNTPDLFGTFYSGQEVRVQTDFSFAAQYSGGAYQSIAEHAPAPGDAARRDRRATIRVRKQFADTAYWNPSVVTDSSGSAKISFTLPDNLTTWRATARGISLDTRVGSTTHDVVSTMPLLVRLELPRFYVAGDEAMVSAVVHNYTGGTRIVQTQIEATGAQLQGEAQRTLTLEAGKEARLDWKAKIDPTAQQSVRFLVTADGGVGAQDAAELTLPVREDGTPVVDAHAETLSESNAMHTLDLSQAPANATLTLSFSPSLAAAIFEALDDLESYPYGCAEQTMSSFLPDVIVAGTLRRLHTNRTPRPDLDRWVGLGLQKLYRYQHTDGGWNWWEMDETDGGMTAYVLWGLVQAREAGYLVDEQRILRGTEALLALLKDEREYNRRADWLLTLAYARPESVVKPLAEAYAGRDKLDTYALASLGLALKKLSATPLPNGAATNFGPMATTVARELEARAVTQGTTIHWPAAVGGYTWREDNVSVTAHALRAVLSIDPQSAQITGVVRWLMGNRSGKSWDSTRSSAEAVFALAQVMEQTKELQPDFEAHVTLDGTMVKAIRFGASNTFDAPVRLTLTPEMWRDHHTLEIGKQGSGVLYLNTTLSYIVPSAEAKPVHRGITVKRTYRILAADPSLAGTVDSGQDIDVETEITADADYKYAVVEDPIPAGCEVDSSDMSSQREDALQRVVHNNREIFLSNMRREVRDNRVVFFFDTLPKGRIVATYRLHAETPGLYRILPSVASLAYFPEIRGDSEPVQARIGER